MIFITIQCDFGMIFSMEVPNTTTKTLNFPGSAVIMEPNTILLELLNENGRYVTIMGRIDATDLEALSQN